MNNHSKKLASVWGAVATGPAIWAGFSMLSAGGLFALEGGSAAYILALLGTGAISLSCGVISCVTAYRDDKYQNQLAVRLQNIEVDNNSLRRQVKQLKRQIKEEMHHDLNADLPDTDSENEGDVVININNMESQPNLSSSDSSSHSMVGNLLNYGTFASKNSNEKMEDKNGEGYISTEVYQSYQNPDAVVTV